MKHSLFLLGGIILGMLPGTALAMDSDGTNNLRTVTVESAPTTIQSPSTNTTLPMACKTHCGYIGVGALAGSTFSLVPYLLFLFACTQTASCNKIVLGTPIETPQDVFNHLNNPFILLGAFTLSGAAIGSLVGSCVATFCPRKEQKN